MDAVLVAKTELVTATCDTAGTCSICQDDFAAGAQLRAIRACKHSFHAACVDPWLTSNGSCPMCRGTVVDIDTRQESDIDAALRMLTEIAQQLETNPGIVAQPAFQELFTNIRTEVLQLTGLDVNEFRMSTRRIAYTYWIVTGLLRKYKTAAAYRPNRAAITQVVETATMGSMRPMAIDMATIASLKRRKAELVKLLQDRLPGLSARGVEANEIVVAERTRIRDAVGHPLQAHLVV